MSNLIANPPSFEKAKAMANTTKTTDRVPTSRLVRTAIVHTCRDEEHYAFLAEHMSNGKVTGSAHADVYLLARELVDWETKAQRFDISTAMQSGKVRLVDIVKCITPEMRKLGFDVKRGTIIGDSQDVIGSLVSVKTGNEA